MEKFAKYDKAKVESHFDEVAENYEGAYLRAGYPDPQYCADYVTNFAKNLGLSKDAPIVDFACGTGLVGQHLNEAGFTNITGFDVSSKMLQIAESKGVYTSLKKLELGQEDFYGTFPPTLKEKFSFVTCAGLINNNHMDEKIFEQMLLSLKNGGIMVFAARYSFIGNYWYNDKLEDLEVLGRLTLLKSDSFFKYDNLSQGVGKFQKTPVKVFAYQKTEADSVLGFKRANSMRKDEINKILDQGVKNLYINKQQLFQNKKKESGMSCVSASTDESFREG